MRRLIRLLTAVFLVAGLSGCSSTGVSPGAPAQVDLTRRSSFPPLVRQQGNSCAQLAGLYYLLGSDSARDGFSGQQAARLSPYWSYAILADSWQSNSHTADGWLLARETGVPALADWPRIQKGWMNGFDRYVCALRHRPGNWEYLPMRTLEDLEQVRRVLASGTPVGCDFQVRNASLVPLPAGSHALAPCRIAV